MLTINIGIKSTHLECQDNIKFILDTLHGTKPNEVPMCIPNYVFIMVIGRKNGDVPTIKYFIYPVFVSSDKIILNKWLIALYLR